MPYRSTTGFQYEVLTADAATRKAIDDLAYNEYGKIKPDKPEQLEHTIVNAEMLLAAAQKTPDFLKIKAAITGLPIDEKDYLSVAALMDKTRGTDAYAAINKIFDEQQRRENETLDSVKFDNDIDRDREKTREQLGFTDATPPAAPLSTDVIFQAAKEEAAHINGDAERQRQAEQTHSKKLDTERGE